MAGALLFGAIIGVAFYIYGPGRTAATADAQEGKSMLLVMTAMYALSGALVLGLPVGCIVA